MITSIILLIIIMLILAIITFVKGFSLWLVHSLQIGLANLLAMLYELYWNIINLILKLTEKSKK